MKNMEAPFLPEEERENRIRQYVAGENRHSKAGNFTKYNNYFVFDLYKARKALYAAECMAYLFRAVMANAVAGDFPCLKYRVHALNDSTERLEKRRRDLGRLLDALGKYPVADRLLVNAIRAEADDASGMAARNAESLRATYLPLCGMESYAGSLADDGTALEEDAWRFFYWNAGGCSESMPDELWQKAMGGVAEKYLTHVIHEMERLGLPFTDIHANLKAEADEMARLEKERRKRIEREKAEKRKEIEHDGIVRMSRKIQGVCDTRITEESDGKFTMVVCAKMNVKSPTIYYGTLGEGGEAGITPEWSFKNATKFIGKDRAKAKECAESIRKKNRELTVEVVDFDMAV